MAISIAGGSTRTGGAVGTGAAGAGSTRIDGSVTGSSSAWVNALALVTNAGKASSSPPRNGTSPTSGASAATASAMASAITELPVRLPLRTWFSRFSNSQAKSPITVAPTIRPLPFRV